MKFVDLLKELNREKIRYLLVGGIAVNLYGVIRSTKDIDLVVYLENKNLLKFCHLMTRLGYKPKVPVKAEDFADAKNRQDWIENKNMIVFSFYHEQDLMNVVDVFVKHPLPFESIYKRKELIPLDRRVNIPVISIPDLIKLKTEASRQQDLADIRALKEILRIRKQNEKTKTLKKKKRV
ncbi:MAG: hypothetical protein HYU97_02700 [Deltaproteobacteria bacterium]|nr:hypothetical protein [Deltaproteobacteria bacterium]